MAEAAPSYASSAAPSVSQLERVVCVAGGWARVRLMGKCVAGKLGGLGRVWWQSWQVLARYLRHWCGGAMVWEAVGGTSIPGRTGSVRHRAELSCREEFSACMNMAVRLHLPSYETGGLCCEEGSLRTLRA